MRPAFPRSSRDFVPTNFAYPYGAASPTARHVLKRYYSSCRGIQPGINVNIPDLAELFANSVYDRTFDEARMRELIERTGSIGGWLIFYTHDVTVNAVCLWLHAGTMGSSRWLCGEVHACFARARCHVGTWRLIDGLSAGRPNPTLS